MKTTLPSSSKQKTEVEWAKTPYPNLIRYKPSGNYFGRVRVNGKLIRRSLETHVLTVAKLKLSDFLQDHRRLAVNKGQSVHGEVIIEMFKKEIEDDHNNKPRTKLYKQEVLTALKKSWPELYSTDIAKISQKDCNEWAARYGKEYSPTRYNGALGIVRRIFEIAMEHGYRVDNPAKFVDRRRVKPKELHLPSQAQFQEMATHIETSGAGQAKDCAALFRFLAFSGLRIDEARHVLWSDVDFEKGLLHVRFTITKNGKDRWIPLNSSLRQLLEKIRAKRADEPVDKTMMQVFECQKSIDRAAKLAGVKRITHHDLRHLFATRCIEAGVDIPTVSRWLGHQDGGALCMKTYGHLRDQHSLDMAQKVDFTEMAANVVSLPLAAPSQGGAVTIADDAGKTAIAQAKAKYAYPWWASTNATEVFWGQLNEPVQIVPLDKFHACAKEAMNREVFANELADRQSLKEEFSVRIPKATLVELAGKIQAKAAESELKAS